MSTSEEEWSLNLTTRTRDEALLMSDFLARAMEPRFFHDPDNVPIFIVTGGYNFGKSMVCEAMSRSLLDQQSIDKMIAEGQHFHHYMETAPSTACHTYCFEAGTIGGEPAAVSFDRITHVGRTSMGNTWRGGGFAAIDRLEFDDEYALPEGAEEPEKEPVSPEQQYRNTFTDHTSYHTGFKRGLGVTPAGKVIRVSTGASVSVSEAFKTHKKVGGAIFSSGHHRPEVTPWIHFEVDQPGYDDRMSRRVAGATSPGDKKGKKKAPPPPPLKRLDEDDPNHPKWHKVWDIEILSEELRASPRFQAFWTEFQAYAKSGRLNDPDLTGIDDAPTPPDQ